MMLEIPSRSERGFVYLTGGEDFLDKPSDYIRLRQVFSRVYGSLKVLTVEVVGCYFEALEGEDEALSPVEIKCVHGNNLVYGSINPLPHDGWEELVDCWSCHSCEFKTVLGLVPMPRKNGVLTSSLFLLINDTDLPFCCRKNDLSIRKIFYNEIILKEYAHSAIIYLYLDQIFRSRNTFLFSAEQKSYEIRYFYKAALMDILNENIERREVLKVGIKRTTKMVPANNNINEFYSSLIYSSVVANSMNVEIFGYRISFLRKDS